MSNDKTLLPFDRKMDNEEFKCVEAQGLHNALRFLAQECKTLGYTNTASLAQSAADTIFLELAAAGGGVDLICKKRKAAPIPAVPKRPALPRGLPGLFGKTSGGRA